MFCAATNNYSLSAAALNEESRLTFSVDATSSGLPDPSPALEWQADVQQVGRDLCQRLVSHLDLDFSAYYRFDVGAQALRLVHQSGLAGEAVHLVQQLPVPASIHQRATSRGRRLQLAAVEAGAEVEARALGPAAAADFAAYLLVVRGCVVGCLGAGKCRRARVHRDERREIAGAALQIALAIDHGLQQAEVAGLKARLEWLEQQRAEWMALLSHELRNPLGALSNALHVMLHSGGSAPAFQRAGEIARRQLRQQARLIDGLLDASRLETGQIALQPERLDFGQLVREAVEDQRPACERAGLLLDLQLPDEAVYVTGDSVRLRQIVHSLLDNALRFTSSGGRISVGLRRENDGEVQLIVRDSGVGMDAELLETLFQPLTQGDRSLARGGGLGLGLAMARRLAALHYGSIAAQSAGPGEGAQFTVTLPLAGAVSSPEGH